MLPLDIYICIYMYIFIYIYVYIYTYIYIYIYIYGAYTDLLEEVVDIGHHLLRAIPREVPRNIALGQEHHHARRHLV